MMNLNKILASLVLALCMSISACSMGPPIKKVEKKPDVLVVQSDGSFVLNNRNVVKSDVIIYPDGFGGEKAAVKVRNPIHPDFFRDTIIVRRE